MVRFPHLCLLLVLFAGVDKEVDSKQTIRPITEAESVVAVYYNDWGLGADPSPRIIFAAWPDGHVVWSTDRLKGGAPYGAAQVDPEKVAALLSKFEKSGIFKHEERLSGSIDPHGQFHTVLIKSQDQQVEMSSGHQLVEDDEEGVDFDGGIMSLDGRHRLDVLHDASREYLFFRFVWSETRSLLADFIPEEGVACDGGTVMKAGILTWQEPAPKAE